MEQIKDMVTLRYAAIELATRTITTATSFNSMIAYDVNNHLTTAKAIENYIKGDAEIPEVENHEKAFNTILENMRSSFQIPKPVPQVPNFKVND